MINVEDIKAEFTDETGTYENFFKVAGERETDARLDLAAEQLKELILVVREGFKETISKLGVMDSSLKEISGKQDDMIDKIDEAREEVVTEVQGLRSDLKGRTEERLQRIESDVVEIKARMRS